DLILLDIMLPKLDGWQVLNTLRSSGIHTPVIMLTAKEQVEDRVRGFELGANDYVVKPYAFAELLARVQNVFRHHIAAQVVASPQTLRVADLELDMIKRVATRAGQSMLLTATEYALLELLMRKTGQVLSRTTIASLVWDMNFDSDTNVIDVAVKRLRSKVDKPFDKPLIHTVRGMGYKLEESRDA
ncbi:winged helix-turn-helix domain-containing protein, partial [Vibrio sp. 1291-1]|uniref:winged helix-turn-helix domain-containing protein n=1 Tax=Vibrio sp. 1291-1 TaxID=3074551 RepID=UPI00296ACC3B